MIIQATHIKNYIIHFVYADGYETTIDFEPRIRRHAIYKRFLKQKTF